MDKTNKLSPNEVKLAQEAGINPIFKKMITPREKNLLKITAKYHMKYTMEKELKNKLEKIIKAQNKIIHIQNNKSKQLRSEIKQLKKSKITNDYIPMDYSPDATSYVQLTEEEQDYNDKINKVKQKRTENTNDQNHTSFIKCVHNPYY